SALQRVAFNWRPAPLRRLSGHRLSLCHVPFPLSKLEFDWNVSIRVLALPPWLHIRKYLTQSINECATWQCTRGGGTKKLASHKVIPKWQAKVNWPPNAFPLATTQLYGHNISPRLRNTRTNRDTSWLWCGAS